MSVAVSIFNEVNKSPHFDGYACIQEMINNGSTQWKQMEWSAFYFEHLVRQLFADDTNITTPGVTLFHNTLFDLEAPGYVADLKVHANSRGYIILNDKRAIDSVIDLYGRCYFIILRVVPEIDDDFTFTSWVEELKGEPSKYVLEGRAKGRRRRKRKSAVTATSLDVYGIDKSNVHHLHIHHQGKNSNGKPRPVKYGLPTSFKPIWSQTFNTPTT